VQREHVRHILWSRCRKTRILSASGRFRTTEWADGITEKQRPAGMTGDDYAERQRSGNATSKETMKPVYHGRSRGFSAWPDHGMVGSYPRVLPVVWRNTQLTALDSTKPSGGREAPARPTTLYRTRRVPWLGLLVESLPQLAQGFIVFGRDRSVPGSRFRSARAQ
jgi:hypothetical protein